MQGIEEFIVVTVGRGFLVVVVGGGVARFGLLLYN